jgi:hypothetical protein
LSMEEHGFYHGLCVTQCILLLDFEQNRFEDL